MEIRRRLGYRPLQFQKRRQLFIGVHNETLSVVGDARQQRNLSTSLPRFR